MYQDKVEKEAVETVSAIKLTIKHNIFSISNLPPKDFLADEDVCDATQIARDILSTRSNKEIMSLANAIVSMLKVGDALLMNLSMTLLDAPDPRTSVVITQGRALYLLHDYFSLTTLPIKNVNWGELFATLTLMQSAEINYALTEVDSYDESLRAFFEQTALHCISQLKEEIIDSIARAECYFDIKAKSKNDGKIGGRARADKVEPLRNEVGRRFLEKYAMFKNGKAAYIIKIELMEEENELLELVKIDNAERTFAGWIKDLLEKKWQLSVQ